MHDFQMEDKLKRAGIIVVGNEVLKGHVSDINSPVLCKRFYGIGVKVCRISTLPDDVEEIAEEVARFSRKYDIVVTTGGTGPTHDGITYEAVASAVGDRVVLHPEMVDVVRSHFQGGPDIKTNPALKMALIPQTSKLIYILPKRENAPSVDRGRHNGLQEARTHPQDRKPFPVVQVNNIYVLPDARGCLEQSFDHLQKLFQTADVNIYTMKMFLTCSQVTILNELNKAVNKFEGKVIFGSYPSRHSTTDYVTKVVLEGTSVDDVTSAYAYLKNLLRPESVIGDLHQVHVEMITDLTYGNSSLSNVVRNSIKLIESAFKDYKPSEVLLSFNGGKDCTVLLHLIWAVLKMLDIPDQLNCLYIKTGVAFSEVDQFVTESSKRYNLNVTIVFGPIKEALTELHKKNPNIKAIFMGTRRTDPFSKGLKELQMCDKDWPPLMRVNPILDWSYQNVWDFLRLLTVPYCELYDQGYTSLGNPKNTQPNPALKIAGTAAKYRPAYALKDGSLERQGRV